MSQLWRIDLEEYRGFPMACAPGTHEAAVNTLLRHVPHRAGALDCGARYGALLARLKDNGFTDLTAVDLDTHLFKLDGVPIRRLDLNADFASQFDRRFKLITCSDVIEHLDSPRHFLQEAWKLLDDDGYLLVTLPNISFWVGRIKFLLKGEHWGFGERHFRDMRHVSPMTFDAMRLTMQEIGFRLLDAPTAGSFFGPLKKLATLPLVAGFRLLGGPRTGGETSLYLAAKTAPDPQLSNPTHYQSHKRPPHSR